MRVERYGDHAALVLVDDLDAVRAWHGAIVALDLDGVVDVVPGERSVVVVAEPGRGRAEQLIAALSALPRAPLELAAGRLPNTNLGDQGSAATREVVIPVYYDGEDLDGLANRTGFAAADVVRLHHEASYEVAFCGFAPGFAYLTGLPVALHVPRRETPRPKVPAGSVAIAAGYSAVYPRSSPGGWWLLGHTELRLFDAEREPAGLLRPGDRVRFVPA